LERVTGEESSSTAEKDGEKGPLLGLPAGERALGAFAVALDAALGFPDAALDAEADFSDPTTDSVVETALREVMMSSTGAVCARRDFFGAGDAELSRRSTAAAERGTSTVAVAEA
jgi:hypothetical protein